MNTQVDKNFVSFLRESDWNDRFFFIGCFTAIVGGFMFCFDAPYGIYVVAVGVVMFFIGLISGIQLDAKEILSWVLRGAFAVGWLLIIVGGLLMRSPAICAGAIMICVGAGPTMIAHFYSARNPEHRWQLIPALMCAGILCTGLFYLFA